MKNVTYLTKLRRFVKSLAVSFVFLMLGVAGSSFTGFSSNNVTEEVKKTEKDSASTDKNGFKGLLSPSTDDGVNPNLALINPRAIKFIEKFESLNAERLDKMKVWGKPYFDIFDGIFAQYGLPKELKYLAVVESSLKQTARSPVGAGGPWQIMPTEARRLGLTVNGKVDERNNYYKSTKAAAKFMKDLYGSFHDWLLVIAAYNCGPGRLRQAIRKSGSKNFWVLQNYLPAETRGHVKNFIATHYVFEGSGGITTMTASEIDNYNVSVAALNAKSNLTDEELNKTMSVTISGKYKSAAIAENVGIDLSAFNHLNPNFDKLMAKGSKQSLRLPVEKMILFDRKKQVILNESVKMMIK